MEKSLSAWSYKSCLFEFSTLLCYIEWKEFAERTWVVVVVRMQLTKCIQEKSAVGRNEIGLDYYRLLCIDASLMLIKP